MKKIIALMLGVVLMLGCAVIPAGAITDPFPDFYTAIPKDDIIAYLDANPGTAELTVKLYGQYWYIDNVQETNQVISQNLMEKIQQSGILFNLEIWNDASADGMGNIYLYTYHLNGKELTDTSEYTIGIERYGTGQSEPYSWTFMPYNEITHIGLIKEGVIVDISMDFLNYWDSDVLNYYIQEIPENIKLDYGVKLMMKGMKAVNGVITLSSGDYKSGFFSKGYRMDLDTDGKITAADALIALKCSVGITSSSLSAYLYALGVNDVESYIPDFTAAYALSILKRSIDLPY